MRKFLIFGLLSLCFLAVLTVYQLLKFSDKALHITFCDVDQGDAIHIRTPNGDDILVDGGPNAKVLDCLSNHMPFWDRQIEAVYMTHPDADHFTGLIGVIKSYKINYFGTSNAPKATGVFEELNRQLEIHQIKKNFVYKGDRVRTKDGFTMTILWPTHEFINNPSQDTNDYSLVQKLEYGKFTVLLTGDVPSVYLNSIMPGLERLDVFKPPHHGSKTGVDEFTFQYVVPKYAVISSGRKNKYGHPNKQVIDVLSDNKIPYKNTATDGDIEIVSDGEKWWVK